MTATKVTLRKRELPSGKITLYLDFYPPIRNPRTMEMSRREYLGIYIIKKPRTPEERNINAEKLKQAEAIRAQRELSTINEQFGFIDKAKQKMDFLAYYKGHLANAEDFAYDCTKDELTFRYYNCLPQTPNLNRGIWKTYETKIREWSQSDSLLIICGGVFSTQKIKNISVPDFCWKLVQSLSSKKILFCGWFTNTDSASEEDISYNELIKRTGYQLTIKK